MDDQRDEPVQTEGLLASVLKWVFIAAAAMMVGLAALFLLTIVALSGCAEASGC